MTREACLHKPQGCCLAITLRLACSLIMITTVIQVPKKQTDLPQILSKSKLRICPCNCIAAAAATCELLKIPPMSPAPHNNWITGWAVRRSKDLANLARKGCWKLLLQQLSDSCSQCGCQVAYQPGLSWCSQISEICKEAAVQTTLSDYSPHAPTGCAGGIHLFVRYTGSPTFQPGTCKPSNNIGVRPQSGALQADPRGTKLQACSAYYA